jgi:hypothetical protein
LTFPQVQSRNLVAFFDRAQGGFNEATSMAAWEQQYENKWIRVTAGSVIFDAQIVDTCGDWDCDGCCTNNINSVGADYLVDVEEQTRLRYFGNLALPATVTFQILATAPGR